MKNIPTVYYGGMGDSVHSIHTPIENLLKHLKQSSPMKNDIYFQCPSFISWAKDKLVMKAPSDISVCGDVNSYVQIDIGGIFFFADAEVQMTTYPPFLDLSTVHGVVGEMDISKWLRPIHPVGVMDEKGHLNLKQEQALLYVGFDRKVKLQKVVFPMELKNVVDALQSYKGFAMKGRTLKKLYDSFMASRCNKIILKKIKEYNDI